jgi:hypothetical protein
MKKNESWVGCKLKSLSFQDVDKFGKASEWKLKRGAVVRDPKIRRIPLKGVWVGFYGGTFTSPSYDAPLAAAGQVFCSVGVGTFEAGGWQP